MENKHTQGRWYYDKEYPRIAAQDTTVESPEGEIAIITIVDLTGAMGSSFNGEDTTEANALLIAAAPELLAALENIVVLWDKYSVDKALAAIAKAKGANNG